ncbi:MAG TPA: hypothetical protein VH475_12405 [Tepidisphaeraceae bacterium]|jgi:hypothetical protein
MSWDLRIECHEVIRFEDFASETANAVQRLLGVRIDPKDIVLESSPGVPNGKHPPSIIGGVDDEWLLGLSRVHASFSLLSFGLKDRYRGFSVELPVGHSPAGFALAAAAAAALAKLQGSPILDDAQRWTQTCEQFWEEFLAAIAAGTHKAKVAAAVTELETRDHAFGK